MAAKSGNLGAKKEAAALLLAVGRSIKSVAGQVGAAERTLRNWMAEEAFQARVQALRTAVFGQAVGSLCSASVRASRVLAKLLGSESENIQLGAARAILEATPRLREAADLASRLEALEAHVVKAAGVKS